MRHWIAIAVAWMAVLLAPVLAWAQPLADHVPANAIIYLGWKGTDSPGDAYNASRLKAVLEASDLPQYLHETLPKLMAKVTEMNPDLAPVMEWLTLEAGPACRHPAALYIGPLDFPKNEAGGPPNPHLALICQAGDDAPTMLEQIKKVLAQLPPMPFPLVAEEHNKLVSVLFGTFDDQTKAIIQGTNAPGGASLLTNENFKKSLKQVGADPVVCFYADVEAALKMVDASLAAGGDAQAAKEWATARDALGLGGLKRVICTGSFDGRDWAGQVFVEAPSPRKGIMAMLDGAPITDDILKTIPKTATLCSAGRFNAASLFEQIKAIAKEIDPQTAKDMQSGLDQLNQMIGMDLEKDVLGVLGDQWSCYCDPNQGGDGILGLVIVNRLADPAKAEAALSKLKTALNQLIHQTMAQAPISVTFEQSKVGDLTIHYLDVPYVTPTWTIKDGNLYLALYPQMAVAAAEYVEHKGPTILDNPAFVALRQRLGGQKVTAIKFMDLPQTAPGAYGMLTLLSRFAAIGDVFGVRSPPMLMPPLPKLMAQLVPAGSITWVDDQGWHIRAISPFPGSSLLSVGGSGITTLVMPSAMMMAVLLPSLSHARETAYRVRSQSNLHQIGTACMLHSNDNNGTFPPDLGTLLTEGSITFAVCFNPSTMPTPPEKLADQVAYVNAHSDYVYLAAGKNMQTIPPDAVVAYEMLHVHHNEGANVLFGDGHVQWLTPQGLEKYLKDQKVEMKP